MEEVLTVLTSLLFIIHRDVIIEASMKQIKSLHIMCTKIQLAVDLQQTCCISAANTTVWLGYLILNHFIVK